VCGTRFFPNRLVFMLDFFLLVILVQVPLFCIFKTPMKRYSFFLLFPLKALMFLSSIFCVWMESMMIWVRLLMHFFLLTTSGILVNHMWKLDYGITMGNMLCCIIFLSLLLKVWLLSMQSFFGTLLTFEW